MCVLTCQRTFASNEKKTCLLCNNFQINHYPWIWLITLFPTAKEYPSCVLLFFLWIIFFLQTLNRLWFFLLVSIQIALFATFLFPLNLQRAWWNVIGLKRFSLKLVSFNYLAADTTPNHDPVELESHLSEKSQTWHGRTWLLFTFCRDTRGFNFTDCSKHALDWFGFTIGYGVSTALRINLGVLASGFILAQIWNILTSLNLSTTTTWYVLRLTKKDWHKVHHVGIKILAKLGPRYPIEDVQR